MRLSAKAAIVVTMALLYTGVHAMGGKYEVLDKQKVYYGDCTSFEKPATVAADEVFPHIHEYKLIGERKLDENDPEYWILLLKANRVFQDALKSVASSSKHDLVAERGAIKAIEKDAALPDITHLVVAEVKRKAEDR